MFRPLVFGALLSLTACGGQPLNFGALTDPATAQRRGAVELVVKSSFPVILEEIDMGGGPNLQLALDKAGVPLEDRPTRILQLRGDARIYQSNPAALVTALLLYGS